MAVTTATASIGHAPAVTIEEDPDAALRHAQITAWEEGRDEWGHPKVVLPDGTVIYVRRASSFGAPLESSIKLDRWHQRQVARGFTHSKKLQLELTRAEVDLDSDVKKIAQAAKDAIDDLCEEAKKLAGSQDKADIGTALHHVCERNDRGLALGFVPEDFAPDVLAWQALIADFEVLSIERIVVQRELKVGGKLDRVARTRRPFVVRKARRRYRRVSTGTDRPARPAIVLPAGTVIIADQKTSQSMDFAGAKFGVQCWMYATGEPYDPITEKFEDWGHEPPSHDWAAILHTPSGQGVGTVHWVDLRAARNAAMDAHTCYEWRNKFGRRLIDETPEPKHAHPVLREHFVELAGQANALATLTVLYEQARACEVWDDALRAMFTARRQRIEAEEAATLTALEAVGA